MKLLIAEMVVYESSTTKQLHFCAAGRLRR